MKRHLTLNLGIMMERFFYTEMSSTWIKHNKIGYSTYNNKEKGDLVGFHYLAIKSMNTHDSMC